MGPKSPLQDPGITFLPASLLKTSHLKDVLHCNAQQLGVGCEAQKQSSALLTKTSLAAG